MPKFLFTLLLYLLSSYAIAAATSTPVYLLQNPNFAGDTDQLRGAGQAIETIFAAHQQPVSLHTIDTRNKNWPDVLPAETTNTLSIAVSAGSDGAAILKQYKRSHKHALTIYLAHQPPDSLNTLLKTTDNPLGADLIALPKQAIDNQQAQCIAHSHSLLLLTDGVSQSMNYEQVQAAYRAIKTQIPPATRYLHRQML